MSQASRKFLRVLPIPFTVLLGSMSPAIHAGQGDAASAQVAVSAPGANPEMKVTEAYARLVARDAYFWAWPMVNLHNRRLSYQRATATVLVDGILPVAPLNRLGMLHDYIAPQQRNIACPNQDVVYGAAFLALDLSPVVIQVPDFGKRFWVYQVSDIRTDSVAELGAMYGTRPGFYLLAGPNWKGVVPKGITRVFRTNSETGFVGPRIFQDDTPEDKQAVQAVIQGIDVYPLAEYNGKMKRRDWSALPTLQKPAASQGKGEVRWVHPETIFDQLPGVLAGTPPLQGEQGRYAQVLAVIAAAQRDPALKKAMIDEAVRAEQELVAPLLEFRNWGISLPYHWTTMNNGARFGTDYFTRTAVAKSNMFVNAANETRYFYQDLDVAGARLNGGASYTVTFAKGQLPPVRGFWSLTAYDAQHFFAPNKLNRYSLGTKNKGLKYGADGSLTIYVQADSPGPDKESNWLPAPNGEDFSLFVRAYWPDAAITEGRWTPPAVVKGR